MFKLIVKSASDTLEMRSTGSPVEAWEIWQALRHDRRFAGMTAQLIAAYESRIFLRHRFDLEAWEVHFVPEDIDLQSLFYMAMAGDSGENDFVRTQPPRATDELLSATEAAELIGKTRQAITYWQKAGYLTPVPGKSPAKYRKSDVLAVSRRPVASGRGKKRGS